MKRNEIAFTIVKAMNGYLFMNRGEVYSLFLVEV